MKKDSSEKRMVLKCRGCGAPVFYDAAEDAFRCPFCGALSSFEGDDGVEEQELVLDHQPVPFSDGCFHLDGLGDRQVLRMYYKEKKRETWQTQEKRE